MQRLKLRFTKYCTVFSINAARGLNYTFYFPNSFSMYANGDLSHLPRREKPEILRPEADLR